MDEPKYPRTSLPNTSFQLYACSKCNSDFYYKGSELIGWEFTSIYKNENFIVNWRAEITTISKNSIRRDLIATFKHRVPLTPYNLLQKLPNILLFL